MKKVLLAGSSNTSLARKIANRTNIRLKKIEISKFSDGEKYVNIPLNLDGKEVTIIQSGSTPSDEHVVELFLIIDAVKRLKSKKVTVVLPFYPYRRQEREAKKGDAVSANVVAKLLQAMDVNKIITIDLHSQVIKNFFKIPLREIKTYPLFADYFTKKSVDLVIAPDEGSIIRTKNLAKVMSLPVLVMQKNRKKHDRVESIKLKNMSGKKIEINNKDVLLFDDEINTAGTLVKNVKLLKKLGARKIYFGATHAVLSGSAISRLEKAGVEEIVVTDSIYLQSEKKLNNLKVISVDKLIAKNIV